MKQKKYPRRPPRLTQIFQRGTPFYFITFNTYKRQPLLANREIHGSFKTFCKEGLNRNICVGCYVIMPDHVHLFVRISPLDITLKSWIQALKTVLGKTLLALGSNKPHWQEGFFDHLLRSGESYSAKWNYVRFNPVRARLCACADDWPYQGEICSIRF